MIRRAVTCAVALSTIAVVPALAQTIQEGTWMGTVAPPGAPEGMPVEYDVSYEDGLNITLLTEMGEFPFFDVAFDGEVLTFNWEPGTPVECELVLQDDGHFEGECVDMDGDAGFLVMSPPGDQS